MARPDDQQARHAVAAAVRRDDGLILAVLRPDEPGEELPGVWGLPAVTLRDGESPEDGVRRLGREAESYLDMEVFLDGNGYRSSAEEAEGGRSGSVLVAHHRLASGNHRSIYRVKLAV